MRTPLNSGISTHVRHDREQAAPAACDGRLGGAAAQNVALAYSAISSSGSWTRGIAASKSTRSYFAASPRIVSSASRRRRRRQLDPHHSRGRLVGPGHPDRHLAAARHRVRGCLEARCGRRSFGRTSRCRCWARRGSGGVAASLLPAIEQRLGPGVVQIARGTPDIEIEKGHSRSQPPTSQGRVAAPRRFPGRCGLR